MHVAHTKKALWLQQPPPAPTVPVPATYPAHNPTKPHLLRSTLLARRSLPGPSSDSEPEPSPSAACFLSDSSYSSCKSRGMRL